MKYICSLIAFLIFSVLVVAQDTSQISAGPKVKTGIEVLRSRGFEGLAGKRVGLVTNPSGVDSHLNTTIDILFEAPEVNLVALYGPEHGVRGNAYAGDNYNGDNNVFIYRRKSNRNRK